MSYVKKTCKIGKGHACCRYLVAGPMGFECAKQTSMKELFDLRVETKAMVARGDNCDGYSPQESVSVLNKSEE